PLVEGPATWEIIQTKIFDSKCVVCHTEGTSFARQSDLVLTADVAYANLIDKVPKNLAAARDGLKLLEQKGLESLYTSFLWEKINIPDWEHFYQDHPDYGELMPMGLPPLTNGELEYIRQWILARAPETGSVADEKLLEDSSVFEMVDPVFVQPPLPTSGIQLHVGPFDVKPNYERELFQYQNIGNTEEIFVNRIEITMRKGSHHFVMYDYPDGVPTPEFDVLRDLRDGNSLYISSTISSLANRVWVYGTQLRNSDYQFPEGVVISMPAGKGLDLNPHYANYTDQTISGEIYVNLHTIDKSQVQHVSTELFLSKEDFLLPPRQESTVIAEYTFPNKRNIFMLTAHGHKHLKEFRIYIKGGARNGELIYYTNDWEHPVLMDYDPPVTLNPGEGLRGEAIYNNDTDRNLKFGLLSVDEMMIIFGAYY
ncbi:MAG: hypothetical protein OEY51_06325, partial [Cyclobacteriaceae bacterium]|nr:hypothetical protein [Cyclobacteriaceae bacterium]